jgi:hypothetical protein
MGWQKEQVEPLGKSQITALVPSCLIHHQEKVLVWSHPLFLCESPQRQRKGLGMDRGHEQPTGLSALRLHVEIQPLVAWSTTALTRLPVRAQTRRKIGLRPMRCSSWLQSSTLASGYACCSLSTSSGRVLNMKKSFHRTTEGYRAKLSYLAALTNIILGKNEELGFAKLSMVQWSL